MSDIERVECYVDTLERELEDSDSIRIDLSFRLNSAIKEKNIIAWQRNVVGILFVLMIIAYFYK